MRCKVSIIGLLGTQTTVKSIVDVGDILHGNVCKTYFNENTSFLYEPLVTQDSINSSFCSTRFRQLPVDAETAASFDLPYLVWRVVAYGELGAAIGLFFGGLFFTDKFSELIKEASDILTRFSGFTIGCIMTGVIWIAQSESALDVILYDNFHVMLWVGGLYFALRGNRT